MNNVHIFIRIYIHVHRCTDFVTIMWQMYTLCNYTVTIHTLCDRTITQVSTNAAGLVPGSGRARGVPRPVARALVLRRVRAPLGDLDPQLLLLREKHVEEESAQKNLAQNGKLQLVLLRTNEGEKSAGID